MSKCPLQNGMECNQRECAWWVEDNGTSRCAIKSLAITLNRIKNKNM